MLLRFKTNEIQEFDNSARHFVNDGQPFEVADAMGEAMLRETANLNPRFKNSQMVFDTINIFEVVKTTRNSILPGDFPHREDLEKNNVKTFADLFALTEADEPKLKNIGEKKLADILAARNSYTEEGELLPTDNGEV